MYYSCRNTQNIRLRGHVVARIEAKELERFLIFEYNSRVVGYQGGFG